MAIHVAPTQNELAKRIADVLIEGFDKHYKLFRATSSRAKQRFEAEDWVDVQRSVKERIRFYDDRVAECVERLRAELIDDDIDAVTWHEAKLLYIGLLVDHKRPELAETFFNSVITRILHRTYAHNDVIFVRAAISTENIESDPPIYRSYYPAEGGLRATFIRLLEDYGWSRPFADLAGDVDSVMRAILEHIGGVWPAPEPNNQVQVLDSAFYRNKAAYVVGKLLNGNDEMPFVIPVLHADDGRLVLDTILLDPGDVRVLFSLSRAYFMVDMDVPSGYVEFLQTMMPKKPRSEIYTGLGLASRGRRSSTETSCITSITRWTRSSRRREPEAR